MKTIKILFTVMFYLAVFYIALLSYSPAIVMYGKIFGTIFSFAPAVILIIFYKTVFKGCVFVLSFVIQFE